MAKRDWCWIVMAAVVVVLTVVGYLFVELPVRADYLQSTFATQEPGLNKYVIDGRVFYANRCDQVASFLLVYRLTRGEKSADILVHHYVGNDQEQGGR